MCKKTYEIAVSGIREDREKLLGSLIENSANLTSSFSRTGGAFLFAFRYKSDARIVLKKMSRQLSGKNVPVKDVFFYRGAVAVIR